MRTGGLSIPAGARLTVALPSDRRILVAIVPDGATAVDVSLASTARTLLHDARGTAGKPTDPIPAEAVAATFDSAQQATHFTQVPDGTL